MKTIQVPQELYEQLVKVSKLVATQDNLCTEHPVYCVYDYEELPLDSEHSSGGESKYLSKDGVVYDTLEDAVKEFRDNGYFDDDDMDEEEQRELVENDLVNEVYFKEHRRFITAFFTMEAAEHFIKANSYHYRKPHVYVESAWRNYEFQALRTLLLTIAKQEGTHPIPF